MILAAAKGEVPGFSPGGKNWVHVQDVANGICNAITKGRLGEAYILGGENLSFKEAISIVSEVAGRPAPKLTFPAFLVKTTGWFGQTISGITGKPPKISLPMASVACDGHYFSPAKAIKELDLPQTPFKQAVEDAMAWFKENGYI